MLQVPVPVTKFDPELLAVVRVLREHGWSIQRIARGLRVGVGTAHRYATEVARLDSERKSA